MRTLYSGMVFYSDKQRQPEPFYELEEFDSVEEFVDTVITLLADLVADEDSNAEQLLEKLNNRDYEVELDCDGEDNYVYVYVHM